jgi:hypothetical protein
VRVLTAGVARDALDLLDRHPDATAFGKMQLEEIALIGALATGVAARHAGVFGDAVVDVNDQVTWLKPLQQILGHDPPKRTRPPDTNGAEELPIGDQHDTFGATGKARVQASLDQSEAACRRCLRQVRGRRGDDVRLAENLR